MAIKTITCITENVCKSISELMNRIIDLIYTKRVSKLINFRSNFYDFYKVNRQNFYKTVYKESLSN